MLFKYCFAKSIKAVVAAEKICSFFHASAVSTFKAGLSGINCKLSFLLFSFIPMTAQILLCAIIASLYNKFPLAMISIREAYSPNHLPI